MQIIVKKICFEKFKVICVGGIRINLTAGSQVLLPGYIRSAGLQLISDMTR
jgi:hypothetical protein